MNVVWKFNNTGLTVATLFETMKRPTNDEFSDGSEGVTRRQTALWDWKLGQPNRRPGHHQSGGTSTGHLTAPWFTTTARWSLHRDHRLTAQRPAGSNQFRCSPFLPFHGRLTNALRDLWIYWFAEAADSITIPRV